MWSVAAHLCAHCVEFFGESKVSGNRYIAVAVALLVWCCSPCCVDQCTMPWHLHAHLQELQVQVELSKVASRVAHERDC
jgi:hypothetical protein